LLAGRIRRLCSATAWTAAIDEQVIAVLTKNAHESPFWNPTGGYTE
jgi:hypothetical protein